MINLYVCRNIVFLSKKQQGYQDFVSSYLVKYESVTKVDFYNSTKYKKAWKTVKERRDLYQENKDYVVFSRGILEMIPKENYHIQYCKSEDFGFSISELDDEEIRKIPKHFDLRDDQVIAVKKCLVVRRGVIQLPTATGKSAIIASTIKMLHKKYPEMKFLVIAPTLSTVKNISDTIKDYDLDVETFGHPHKEIVSDVTASLVKSLVSSNDASLLSGIDAVFYDECLPGNSLVLLPDYSHASMYDVFHNDDINEVMSYNTELGVYESKRVLRKFRSPFNDRFCKVYYTDAIDGRVKGVTCTLNHKIYTSNRGYVQAQDLTSDDFIKVDFPTMRNLVNLNKITFMRVLRVSRNIGKVSQYKYNIEVEDNHNYFANSVLVSNCHHLQCDTWNKLNTMLPNVVYSLGFSALSIDKDEIFIRDFSKLSYNASLIAGSSGPVLLHMPPSYYIERGIIALPVIFRVLHNDSLPDSVTDPSNWNQLVKFYLMSTSRTLKVCTIARMFSQYGRKVLILVSERDYAFTIGKYLVKMNCDKFGISFGSGEGYVLSKDNPTEYNNEDSMEVLDKLSRGEINILIATNHLDEGVDVKGLDACILSNGGKKDRRIIQRIGRVLRKSKNGKYAYVVDFTDSGSHVLSRQSNSRLKMYKEDIGVPVDNIFNGINFSEVEEEFKRLEGLI